jgi:hypothetical protein
MEKTVSIKIKPSNLNRIKALKHPGQSIDGVLEEVLDKIEKEAVISKEVTTQ